MRTPGKRLLGPGYAEALRVFADGPATWRDVAERLGTRRQSAQAVCHGFCKQGLIHIAEWTRVKVESRQYLTPVYVLGEGENAPNPVYTRESKARVRPELLAFCQLIRELQDAPWHAAALSKHLGCSVRSLRVTMKRLHALKLTRIEEWKPRQGGGPAIGLTGWGPDIRDTPRPPKLSVQEMRRKHNRLFTERRRQIKLLHAMAGNAIAANDERRAA